MRILLSTDAAGGVWDHSHTLAAELRRLGHDVLLAVLGELAGDRADALRTARIEYASHPFRLEWMPDAAADVAPAAEWLRRLTASWRTDVAHLNQMAYAAIRFPCPVLVAVHSDVLSWFQEVRGSDVPAEWDAYRGWVADGLGAADFVVAPSRYQAERTERHYGRAMDAVIYNGVVPPAEPPPSCTGAPVLLTVGRAWDEAKGIRVLDEALARLGDAAPPAHLVGDVTGPDGSAWVPRRLMTHGRLPRAEVDGWMRRAHIYVAPSLYEPFGLAPLEAALHDCALVLSDIGSFRELWDGCALFTPPGDADALAAALARLATDAPARARLAAAARTRALRRYGARTMAERYATAYSALLAGSAPTGHRERTELVAAP